MKLPKNYFENLTISKYRAYLKLLPAVQQENTRLIFTLILTFFAMSFFGIFAINPTLSTIITLRKELADDQIVYDSLKTKITNLSSLQQQYTQLTPDLPFVFEAIPQETNTPGLFAQILGLAKEKNIKIDLLSASNIPLSGNTQADTLPAISQAPTSINVSTGENKADKSSYPFFLKAEGTYEDLISFSKTLTQINRLINLNSMSLDKDEKNNSLILSLSGRAYYLK